MTRARVASAGRMQSAVERRLHAAFGRPRLLDLYCGGGGAAMGYYRAGFDVTGVDVAPQPEYPFAFVQGDAVEYLRAHGAEFDAVHASPPCQRHSVASKGFNPIGRLSHPDLIPPTRAALEAIGRPWIMENVVGAPLHSPVTLCGQMFGLGVIRHRWFESSIQLGTPAHPRHGARVASLGRRPREGELHCVVGGVPDINGARAAMGIDWLAAPQLKDAIPPAYTEFLGRQLLAAVLLAAVTDRMQSSAAVDRMQSPQDPQVPRVSAFADERARRSAEIRTGYTSVRITRYTKSLLDKAAETLPRRSDDELIAELAIKYCGALPLALPRDDRQMALGLEAVCE